MCTLSIVDGIYDVDDPNEPEMFEDEIKCINYVVDFYLIAELYDQIRPDRIRFEVYANGERIELYSYHFMMILRLIAPNIQKKIVMRNYSNYIMILWSGAKLS